MNDSDETMKPAENADAERGVGTDTSSPSDTSETLLESNPSSSPCKWSLRGAWRWYVGAAVLVLAGLLCVPGKKTSPESTNTPQSKTAAESPTNSVSSDQSPASLSSVSESPSELGLANQINEIKAGLEQLRRSIEQLMVSRPVASQSSLGVEKARELEKAGDHERAGYYWRNAVEHASDAELLPVLGEYAEAFFNAKTEDTEARYAEAATLERLAELALVRVPTEKMDEAFELRDKCTKFQSDLLVEMGSDDGTDAEEDSMPEAEPIAKTVADSAQKLLNELEQKITNYSGPSKAFLDELEQEVANISRPSKTSSTTEEECLILQLCGVAETTVSQLWFLDRSGLDENETKRIEAFPSLLAKLIDKFNEKYDAPLVDRIKYLSNEEPPKSYSYAPHQRNVEFYTNQVSRVSAVTRHLRGTKAQASIQPYISSIMEKVSDERRRQSNEYQMFVANCCRRSFDSYDPILGTTSLEYGRVPKGSGYKNEDDFIDRKIRSFSHSLSLGELRSQTKWDKIFINDTLVSQSLMRKSGGPSYFDVANHHKAFIILAINGMFRIDQSFLTPETSRMFNDVFSKFNEKMEPSDRVKAVSWMVDEPKIRLEDF